MEAPSKIVDYSTQTNAFVINLINQTEAVCPVEEWRIFGIDMWPVLRCKISPQIQTTVKKSQSTKAEAEIESRFSQKIALLFEVTNGLKTLLQLIFANLKSFHKKNVSWFLSDGLSKSKIGNVWVDKLLGPIYESENSTKIFMDHITFKDSKLHPNSLSLHSLERVSYIISRILIRFIRKRKPAGYDKFLKVLTQSNIDAVYFDVDHVHMYAIQIKALYYMFLFMGLGKNLKSIYIVAYYCHTGFALCHFAKRKGIQITDVQHGLFTDHFAYVNYSKVPEHGYNILPSNFWVWDQNSKQQILEDSHINFKKNHRIIVSSIPNITSLFTRFSDKKDKEFLTKIKKCRYSVLITLTPEVYERNAWDNLSTVIDQLGQDYFWLIRSHPCYANDTRGMERILSHKQKNVNYKEASELPISILMNTVDLHITTDSSAAIEAGIYNIKSLFLSELCYELYPHLMENGTAVFAEDVNEMIEKIKLLVGDYNHLNITAPILKHQR